MSERKKVILEQLTKGQLLEHCMDVQEQLDKEKRKGTLEKGKLADLVVLSHDPLAIDPMKIKDIKVLETIKEGRAIYRAGA